MAAPIIQRIENGPFFVNTYLLGCPETKQGLLIDPGHEVDRIQAAIDASGLTINAITNTHGHIDHVASVAHFRDSLNVPFQLHSDDVYFIEVLAETCRMYNLPPIPEPPVDERLEVGQTVTVGSVSFTTRHAPGHSPGSLIFDLGDEMIVGDVVFQGSIGRTDLPRGDTATLMASIDREVLSKPDATRLWPGHGPETTVGAERAHNPFLT